MNPIKVLLVDDHAIVRDGIKALIQTDGIEVIGEASTAKEFFSLLKVQIPDIAILDISLPDISGIEITKKLAAEYPVIKVIILSMHLNEDFIFNAVKAGALAYLPKNSTRQELIEAIRKVAIGEEYFSEPVSNIILKSYIKKAKNEGNSENSLSSRELEILKLFAEGKTNKEMADLLFISTRTVESHKNHIMQKLGLKSTVELIKFAIKNHIIEI
ncbi:MAG: response regulator transcription factor [Bacteroidales bacterium]|nr:response regulator transcription factor [Bacteroidales bacterium]MCF8402587.1 response regulator transcription factor [Bacteroidales bacterium]